VAARPPCHLDIWSILLLALALAAVGLYSVVSYTVTQRTNEFGIRMALGAQREHVARIVFASMLVSVGSGLLAGVGFTLALNRILAAWAEGSSRDPIILLAAALVLTLVAGIACALPARRASQVEPMTALRVSSGERDSRRCPKQKSCCETILRP
jgi:ABC-type antimicrobial peptide transport system permease subunit